MEKVESMKWITSSLRRDAAAENFANFSGEAGALFLSDSHSCELQIFIINGYPNKIMVSSDYI